MCDACWITFCGVFVFGGTGWSYLSCFFLYLWLPMCNFLSEKTWIAFCQVYMGFCIFLCFVCVCSAVFLCGLCRRHVLCVNVILFKLKAQMAQHFNWAVGYLIYIDKWIIGYFFNGNFHDCCHLFQDVYRIHWLTMTIQNIVISK